MKRREFITLLRGALDGRLPLAPRSSTLPVIGFMSSRSPEDSVAVVAAFRSGLSRGGLAEGKNVLIEFRWARGDYDKLPAIAAELSAGGWTCSWRPAVARAAKAATSTVPIVFGSGDPVKAGSVASLNRPGGNATGVHILTNDLEPKRLGLLHELFPCAAVFGALLTWIMRDGEQMRDGCGKNRAIHVANRCSNELRRVSALRHSRHEQRYAASLRPSICRAQETHN